MSVEWERMNGFVGAIIRAHKKDKKGQISRSLRASDLYVNSAVTKNRRWVSKCTQRSHIAESLDFHVTLELNYDFHCYVQC